ncbi:MAG: exodeoxyribonuclease VII large subunit [Halothiobacillaceae bacterium]
MSDEPKIQSVTELAQDARDLLEGRYADVAVEGEIGQVSRPASGHLYFSIKDEGAQIACAMFRREAQRVATRVEQGKQVQLRGRISLYVPRGNFQLIVSRVEPAGLGALHQAFEKLRASLEREGLFDPAAKRPVPKFPTRIAVVTSATGAAIRDVRSVLARRYPAGEVLIVPAVVQGEQAVPSLLRALDLVAATEGLDVLLLVRGGGSLEDLWAFNDEALARRLRDLPVPVITGIGHETDFTIADFVADLRAPTPPAAAELATPNTSDLLRSLSGDLGRLERAITQAIQRRAQRLDHLQALLQHRGPARLVADRRDQVERLLELARTVLKAALHARRDRLQALMSRLAQSDPRHRLRAARQQSEHAAHRLQRAIQASIAEQRQRLALCSPARLSRTLHTRLDGLESRLAHAVERLSRGIHTRQQGQLERLRHQVSLLHAVSPLQTLARGYAIARHPDGKVIRGVFELSAGQDLRLLLRDGEADCRVEQIREQDVLPDGGPPTGRS